MTIGIFNYGVAGGKELDNFRTILLGHKTLERHVFYLFEYPYIGMIITLHDSNIAVAEGGVGEEVYVHPHGTYIIVMHRVVEREVLKFIIPHGTKNYIILGKLRQDFLNFLSCTIMKFHFSMF